METRCRHFSGYKPCSKSKVCDRTECSQFSKVEENILIIHLGALGAVVRSTALLLPIKVKHPHSRIIWITDGPADRMLRGHSLIDHVIDSKSESLTEIAALDFSAAYCIDKSRKVSGLLRPLNVKSVYGFVADPISGAIVPATEHARELWDIGLSDQKKFFENQKTENQLIHEALNLGPYLRDDYALELNSSEWDEVERRHQTWKAHRQFVIGINVGCSPTIPYKKMSAHLQRDVVIEAKRKWGNTVSIVLLGGREDQALAQEIAKGLDVVISPLDQGLRDGMISLAACDVIVTGDSLGLHLGVGFKKWVVAWFGATCAHEIDLYDRGVKVMAQVPCGPCWRRSCSNTPMCYDRVPVDQILKGIEQGVQWKFSSSKPHSPAISF